MSFVDLGTLTMHRRAEMEGRINTFDEKCDRAINDIKKLKMQARSFLTQLNCDPTELKDKFLNVMKKLDEYTYLITDFNLALGQFEDLANSDQTPVQDESNPHKPLAAFHFTTSNLMDALSEPAPSTACACSNLCPPEKQARAKLPKQDQALISFSSSSTSSESVPSRKSAETASKEVQCMLLDKMEAVKLEDTASPPSPDVCILPAQTLLEVENEYHGVITVLSGACFWVITDDSRELADFMHDLTDYCEKSKTALTMDQARSLTYCVYYDDDTRFYYRAMIIREDQEESEKLSLFLLDTGELRCAGAQLLQPLPELFTHRPPYARLCHLAGIDLDINDKELMKKYEAFMTQYMSLPCSFIVDENESESIGVLVICGDKVLNDVLVEEGLAVFIDKGPVKDDSKSSNGNNFTPQPSSEYTPHLSTQAAEYMPHLPPDAANYFPHLPPPAAIYSPHLPPEAAKYSPHLPPEAAKYSPHMPPEAAKYSPQLPPEAAKYSPHLPPEAAKYSPHLPPEAAKYSPHLPSKTAHLPAQASRYSPSLTAEAVKCVSHSDVGRYSPHSVGRYSPHSVVDPARYSPRSPANTTRYSPQPRSGPPELLSRDLDLEAPEYDDPVVAVTGYHNRDEEDICKHYKGAPDKTCFKGARCTKKHIMKHPDGWTLDKVEVLGANKLQSLPLPAPGSWLKVQVSHVAHFDRVYVNLVDDSTHREEVPEFGVILPPKTLAGLIRDMNSAAAINTYQPLTMTPAPGELVAALYPPDGRWYRGRVLTVTRADQSLEVQYIDYGTVLWIKEDQIRVLDLRYCVLPIQAIRCVLAGVHMTSQNSHDWACAKRALTAVLQDRTLHAHVISRDYDEITVDLVDDDDYSIAQQLAAQGLFEFREYTVTDDSHVTQKHAAA